MIGSVAGAVDSEKAGRAAFALQAPPALAVEAHLLCSRAARPVLTLACVRYRSKSIVQSPSESPGFRAAKGLVPWGGLAASQPPRLR